MTDYDVIIVGAGIAGASVASEISEDCSVLILEAEYQPGYHSTGRSAAFWTESYGGPLVQPLTTASCAFLKNPPAGISEKSLLLQRGAINIGRTEEAHLADQLLSAFSGSGVAMDRWSREEIQTRVPLLKTGWDHAIFEPDCCDIDVAGLHTGYLANARRNGTVIQCNARVTNISRTNDIWRVKAGDKSYSAPVLVNAAGAWADTIANFAGAAPIGIQPMLRTMVQLRTDPPSHPDVPLVVALDGSFYFKPEASGSYWLSPHDETAVLPGDVAPEEMDVAVAIDRFLSVLDVNVQSVTRKWAGLRSFAPDRLPVYGFDPEIPGFFWFAGQGGFGIQTAPAAAKLAHALLLGNPKGDDLNSINPDRYDPARFR
ncbi:FAD-binding oxidoreductase [Parasphingorhabdus sp.]|uniref:NAD(P)/FAD-dependent oxidoreductase n=1 Tax=Parasphingorhabdus sp. TaxID=2709688 RepID=UPI003264A64B